MPPNFVEKTFVNSHKTAEFTKIFSLESFPLYNIQTSVISYWKTSNNDIHRYFDAKQKVISFVYN